MASKGGVIVVVSGEDKTGEVFAAVKKHLEETKEVAKETSESLGEVGEFLKRGLETAGIAIGFQQIADGLKEMIKSTMEAGVQIGKLHQQTGISTESLSALKYAAGATGVEFETVAKSGKKLAEAIHETDAGKLSEGFKILGISTDQVRAKGNDMYGVMALIADKFQQMPDGVEKNVAAVKLFGKAGQDMIPILNQGSEALERMKSEAPIFSEDDIKRMEDMHHSLNDLDAAWQRMGLSITSVIAEPLASYFNDLSEGIDTILSKMKDINTAAGEVGMVIGAIANGVDGATLNQLMTAYEKLNPMGSHSSASADTSKGGSGGSGGDKDAFTVNPSRLFDETVATNTANMEGNAALSAQIEQDNIDKIHSQFDAIRSTVAEQIQETQAARDAELTAAWAKAGAMPDFGLGGSPTVVKGLDTVAIANEAEKFAHGLFDPLFNLGEKWDKQWKQIRANMLKDIGQGAESQLFGALFGDSSGKGGKGWDGSGGDGKSGHNGILNQGVGAVSNLVSGLFKKPSSTSNGGVGAGAGTVATAAASLLQTGNKASGAMQVIVNNLGTPQAVTSTQMSGGGGMDPEQMVIQIFTKDLSTNGPMAQSIQGLTNS